MKLFDMETGMNFLDMLEDSLPPDVHDGALKEINCNETKQYDKHLPVPSQTILPEYPDKVLTYGGGGQDVTSSASRKLRMQRCAHEGCEEVTYKSRTSRHWVCKAHQNKMNKDMLKRKLEERSRTPGGEASVARKKDGAPGRPGGAENSGGASAANQFRPSLLEEVLNEKKMTLMRSPDVVSFLRGKQKRVEERKRLELQLKFEPVDTVSSSSSTNTK